ncbi:helix-turn-helix domain-containing protein [Streptomyces sp. NPDC058665]|uniref:helix-turn-helix domain-containing protein n=1 Tax=Streptomyces sp. NPDC058665 TaxID=3346586 RepID=UPI00365A80A7
MGRRESAVVAGTRQSKELALWLRSQRERRAVTYATMAELTGHRFSPATLSRGASGRKVSREVVLAYAEACGADPDEALQLWKAAQRAEARRRFRARASTEFGDLATSVRTVMTHPKLMDHFGKLRDAMVELRAREGQPSLREMQGAAGKTHDGRHRLPRSSLSVILRGEEPPSRAHLTAFLEVLSVPAARIRLWEKAWDRITESEARKPPEAAKVPRVASPPVAPPDGPPVPETTGTGERDPSQARVLFDTAGFVRMPGPWHSPRPNPPVALTSSGLPIRRPRRAPVLPRDYTSVSHRYQLRIITREGAAPPLPLQDSPAPETTSAPPALLPPPQRPPTARLMSRMVKRLVPRKPRRARTRWPNY